MKSLNETSSASKDCDWQRGCPEIIRGLRAKPIWNAADVPGVCVLENRFERIRDEFLSGRTRQCAENPIQDTCGTVKEKSSRLFQPYRSPRTEHSGN